MKERFIASLIAEDQRGLEERFFRVKDIVNAIHLDVMDGKFVQSESFDFDFTLPEFTGTVEVHLMVEHPLKWVQQYKTIGDVIIFQAESKDDIGKTISAIKSNGKKVGIAINPRTPISTIEPFIKEIDRVLVLTVKPGHYGGRFLPETLDKVRELKKIHPKLQIEVDGSVNHDTLTEIARSGADLFVVGSHFQKSIHPDRTMEHLLQLLEIV